MISRILQDALELAWIKKVSISWRFSSFVTVVFWILENHRGRNFSVIDLKSSIYKFFLFFF